MSSKRIETEKATVKAMVEIYCNANHGINAVCEDCENLIDYALLRTDRCKYKDKKPACQNCKTHCYKAEYREKIKEVMRFSGPRMIYFHPVLSLKHLISKFIH
jgi:hypothetical protein